MEEENDENIAPLTPQRSAVSLTAAGAGKRRSWFETTPTRLNLARTDCVDEQDLVATDCLELTHFTRPAYLQYNRVRVGGAGRELLLLLKNPYDEAQNVAVERLPKKDFSVDVRECEVASNDSFVLRLTWRPSQEGRIRESIYFRVNDTYRLCAYMLGEAMPSAKPHQPPRRLFANRSAAANSILSVPEALSSTPRWSAATVACGPSLFDDSSLNESHEFLDSLSRSTLAESTFIGESRPSAARKPLSAMTGNARSHEAAVFKQPRIGELTVNRATLLRRRAADESSVKKKSGQHISRPASAASFHFERKRTASSTPSAGATKRRCSLDETEPAERSVRSPRRTLRPNMSVCSTVSSPMSAPNPYASKNAFYDAKWMEKQEWGFTRWLNFVFNPLLEEALDPGAISKEAVSLRTYSDWRQLNRLRRAASTLFQSPKFSVVARKMEREVEEGRFRVRKDVCLRADKGLQRRLLDLITSFNPLWLRVALETICGDLLCSSGTEALARFAHSRVLWSAELAREFAHPNVVNFYKPGFDEALNRHIMKRFLHLIFFLDTAKAKRLIDFDPCLFRKAGKHKTTKSVLLAFSRDYLAGEGDLSKHLTYLGFTPRHEQSPLEEFDFAVKNLAIDLRDGIRLVKLTELLLEVPPASLMSRVRCPAVSRLQKVHNADVALGALRRAGVAVKYRGSPIDARDVVDGHREKTLSLLLCLVLQLGASHCLPSTALRQEVAALERALGQERVPEWPTDVAAEEEEGKAEGAALLLHWVRLVCRLHAEQVCPTNLSRSFSDGRALCLLVHHYQPGLLALSDIRLRTTQSAFADLGSGSPQLPSDFSPTSCRPRDWDQLVRNERENQRSLQTALTQLGGIPMLLRPGDLPGGGRADDKLVFASLCYLCARLLDQDEMARAARTIQSAWRARRLAVEARAAFLRLRAAAVSVQRWWRHRLPAVLARRVKEAAAARRREAEEAARECERRAAATVTLQRYARGWAARKVLASERGRQMAAAVTIQRLVRGWTTRLRLRRERVRHEAAAMTIQAVVRRWLEQRRREAAAITIQRRFRAWREERQRARAAVSLQRCVRSWLERRRAAKEQQQRQAAAAVVQRCVRAWLARGRRRALIQERQAAAVALQSAVRGWLARRRVTALVSRRRAAAETLQKVVRAWLDRRRRERAAVTLQRAVRAWLERQRRHRAAVCLQRAVRAWAARREVERLRSSRRETKRREAAAIVIQRAFRRQLTWALIRRAERWHAAAETVQSVVRGWLVRRRLQRQRRAAVMIQTAFRRHRARREEAATVIQARVRGFLHRRRFLLMRTSVLRLQLWWMRILVVRHAAAATIQTAFRESGLSRWLRRRRTAAVIIQAAWRGKRQRDSLAHDMRVVEVRQRIISQLAEVSEEDRLCNRARFAVDSLLRQQMVTEIMKTLDSLNVVTRLSPTLCEYISESGAIPTLYRLFAASNRSLPHMDIMAATMLVLLNLGRHPPSRGALWTDNCASTLVQLLVMTQNANPSTPGHWLFARAACLLALLCENNEQRRAAVLADTRIVRRLSAMRTCLQRREQIRRRRTSSPGRSRVAERRARERFCLPDWRRVGRASDSEVELPAFAALNFLTESVLRLSPE